MRMSAATNDTKIPPSRHMRLPVRRYVRVGRKRRGEDMTAIVSNSGSHSSALVPHTPNWSPRSSIALAIVLLGSVVTIGWGFVFSLVRWPPLRVLVPSRHRPLRGRDQLGWLWLARIPRGETQP